MILQLKSLRFELHQLKTTFTGFSRLSEHLGYLIEGMTDEGQIVGHFEVKKRSFLGILPSSVIAVVDDAAAPAFLKTHPTPIAAI